MESEGCSATDKAQNGVTPLHLAAAKGSINCLRWLTENNLQYALSRITVEHLNKGHFGANSCVSCREVVPISEVK